MEKFKKITLYKGATSVIEFDLRGFDFDEKGICQFAIENRYTQKIIYSYDFTEAKKYYMIFKDEFTATLRDVYQYDVMYLVNNERYPECDTSEIEIKRVLNDYQGELNENAVEVFDFIDEDTEINDSIKIENVYKAIVNAKTQEKSVDPNVELQEVLPDPGYAGLSKVIVQPVSLGEKIATPTEEEQIITPDPVHIGLSQVKIQPIPGDYVIPSGIQDIKENGVYGVSDKEWVDVDVQPVLEEKEVTPTKEIQIVTPNENYDAISKVVVNAIPENYIEPNGEMEITENGIHNVREVESVKVDVPRSAVEINNASYLFYDNARIEGYDFYVSAFKDVTNMNNMFALCDFSEIDVSKIDTKKVTTMSRAFYQCYSLANIDLTNWQLDEVTTTSEMFSWNRSFTSLIFSNKNATKLTSVMNMFASCNGLINLDLSNWNLKVLQTLSGAFQSCEKLETLNLNNWDLSSVTNVGSNLFTNCKKLTNLIFGVNLGKGFTQKTSNYSNYAITLSSCNNLTHDSLMSVINGLYDLNLTYDVANGGTLYRQKLVLGATNLAKLTEEEIAVATNKGWIVS